jgi:hypothetical protein
MKSMEMALVHAAIENQIMGFVGDPPDTDFQSGYLFALCDLLVELGGKDYGEFAIMCQSSIQDAE